MENLAGVNNIIFFLLMHMLTLTMRLLYTHSLVKRIFFHNLSKYIFGSNMYVCTGAYVTWVAHMKLRKKLFKSLTKYNT